MKVSEKLDNFELLYLELRRELSSEELNSSVTFNLIQNNYQVFKSLFDFLKQNLRCKDRMIDLGCGYGFVAFLFKSLLNFEDAWGIDIDVSRLNEAKKYIKTLRVDLEEDHLPFPDNYFDLATSFGVLDHMVLWDNFFSEVYRILKLDSLLVICLTNLSGWDSRFSLLLGYQPRHVEVSKRYLVGVHKYYSTARYPVGHIHTSTFKAMVELGKCYGFKTVKTWGLKMHHDNLLTKLVDEFMHKFPSLSIRYLIILRKVGNEASK